MKKEKVMDTKFILPLAIGLALQAAAGVWWLATMSAKSPAQRFSNTDDCKRR